MINQVCFSPQPRAVKNVYNAVGTNPSGTGTSFVTVWTAYVNKFVQRVDQVVLPRTQHQLATVLIEDY